MQKDLDTYKRELKKYSDILLDNFKEDIQLIKTDPDNKKPQVATKQYVAVVPLPQEIQIEEVTEVEDGSYYVIFHVKCGLRSFITKCYIGITLNEEMVHIELKRCIENAIQQCLKYDKGQIQQISESGNIIHIQSL